MSSAPEFARSYQRADLDAVGAQMWIRAEHTRDEALRDYMAICDVAAHVRTSLGL